MIIFKKSRAFLPKGLAGKDAEAEGFKTVTGIKLLFQGSETLAEKPGNRFADRVRAGKCPRRGERSCHPPGKEPAAIAGALAVFFQVFGQDARQGAVVTASISLSRTSGSAKRRSAISSVWRDAGKWPLQLRRWPDQGAAVVHARSAGQAVRVGAVSTARWCEGQALPAH